MIYVGIDVSKDKHDCHIFDSDGVVLKDDFSFANSRKGFDELKRILLECSNGDLGKIKVGFEATGHYADSLATYLDSLTLNIVRFNPLSVSKSKQAGTLRRTKTDKNDARYIASLLVSDSSTPYRKPVYHILTLKSLTRARFRLIKEVQPTKNVYRRLIHILFPEITDFFYNLYSPSVLSLLHSFPSAKQIAECNITKLSNLLKKSSRGRISEEKAKKLKESAKNSIGVYNPGFVFELKQVIERILFYEHQKADLEKEISRIMEELDSPITTIPGIGTILGATIISEIGDISNFSTSSQLLAFAGAEPSCYQSGKYNATSTPMVKHGSKQLRYALYLATTAAYINSPMFREYISKKKAQGKHYFVAISHGMKKMTRVIFAVLTKNVSYSERI